MTDVAIITNQFSRVADVLAVMTTKTTGRVEVSEVIWMSGPIGFHLGEEVGLEDALRFADRGFDRVGLLRVQLAVVGSIKPVETRCNCVERLLLRRVGLVQYFHCLPFQVRQRRVESAGGKRLVQSDIRR